MAKVRGHYDPRFREVSSLLEKFVNTEQELGASILVNVNGQDVVDIWCGYADEGRSRAWHRDTIVNVFSITKTVLSLAILILVDRGLLDVDEKVSQYWPEFAVNGKQDIQVRHVLSHTSGISGWADVMALEDVYDFDVATAKLAQQHPWWTPGTASGYHALSMGHILGVLVRRTTGKTLKEFVAEEIAAPLGADFQIGALEKDWDRISNIVPPDGPAESMQLEIGSIMAKTLLNPALGLSVVNSPGWRQAELGAANGHGNARSIGRILSVISLGGKVDGRCLLSEEAVNLIFQEQSNCLDLVLGKPLRFGIGYALTGAGRTCYWGGAGGSLVFMDCDRRVTVAYVMNKMNQEGPGIRNERALAYLHAINKALAAAGPKM
ncbi:CVNH domain-containing protein [Purpureocillium lavendulum]|uniref:CVNH domain-containing protein n=1 Tax=Purpureocillium lavendulum TaxID=1247861 RepID=A0AB34FG56_9HYPO|nr:CVNH domain-containing protein [Purpureocillium lavendulum]